MNLATQLLLLAQEGAKNGGQSPDGFLNQILMCTLLGGGFLLIWYFIFIRPKQKEKEERNDMLESLEKHDKIVTIGGLHGKITGIEEDYISVRIDEDSNTEVKCKRWAIRDNLTKQDDEEDDEENS